MKGLEYGSESTASVSVSLTDVDEAPEFSLDILDVTVPEDTTKGSVLLTVQAKDPEGKEIRCADRTLRRRGGNKANNNTITHHELIRQQVLSA